MKTCLIFAFCVAFLFAGSFRSIAADGDTAGAQAAAQSWLALIDNGKYEDSYAAGCIALHQKIAHDSWNLGLKAVRTPHGTLLSRKETSHTLKPNGFEGLDGQCLVLQYDTAFKNLPNGFEVVIMKYENGKWKGAGYTVGAKPSAPAAIAPPAGH